MQQVFAKGRQLFVVSALAVDQQNHIDVAGRKTVDQARQQLQFEILYALGVRKNHETLGCGFVGLVQRLVQRQGGKNFIETVDQPVRVSRGPQLDMGFALFAQMLKDAPTVMRQGNFIVAQYGQVQTPFAQ